MTPGSNIPYINFVAKAHAQVPADSDPYWHLGIQSFRVPRRSIPRTERPVDYFFLRIAATFGIGTWRIDEGRLNVRVSGHREFTVIHDMYPRREETVSESNIEVGIAFNFSWGLLAAVPGLKYQTIRQSFHNSVQAQSVLGSNGSWVCRRRKGERRLEGIFEGFLTIQTPRDQGVTVWASLQGTGRGVNSRDAAEVTFSLP